MIDVSDGIASDLTWICLESGVGAEIYQEKLPISPACEEAAKRLQDKPPSVGVKWRRRLLPFVYCSYIRSRRIKKRYSKKIKKRYFYYW
ncbi:hypothetical protein DMNBHIDG_02865 [Candidatus Methanoperedenaceae archaeon GB37]|nr:hypothetical protein DMNBHIDG_02865 [Candidatus Methanoperedenaceae archaeon GB37]